jgi:ABC-2 type transport system ATP-binding protein
MTEAALALENMSLREGSRLLLDRVSFSIPAGSVYALLGRAGTGKSSLVRCALGQQKPSEGRCLLFGEDARRNRRKFRERIALVAAETAAGPLRDRALARALEISPELLVLDDPTRGLDESARKELFEELGRKLAEKRITVLFATSDPAGIETIADRVGILSKGRLVVDEDLESLLRRFRRISYRNEITETRTEYGTELDAFDAVRVRVRGWGVEAVVSNFDDPAFEAFLRQDGVTAASAAPMSLADVFAALAEEPVQPGPSR